MAVITTQEHPDHLEIRLTRPEAHNALNLEIMAELTRLFKTVVKNKQVRAIVLRGEGPSFCAGADINWMRDSLNASPASVKRDSQKLLTMYETIFKTPIPLIAYVHGRVLGGGLGLLAVADWVVAESHTNFCFSEVKLGIAPAMIATYVLHRCHVGKITPWMLSAQNFDAAKAQELGLVDFTGPAAHCEQQVQQQLQALQNNGPEAVRAAKQLLRRLPYLSWQQRQSATLALNVTLRRSAEGQEGMRAFFEKRPPAWRKV